MPRQLEHPDRELQSIMGAEMERKRLEHYRSMANPQQAAMVAGYGEQMPWLNGKAAVALASQGIPPDSPLAQEAGRRAADKKTKSGGFMGIGGLVGGGLRMAVKGAKIATKPLAEIVKPVSRVGFMALSAPLEEIQGLARAGIYGVSTGDWGDAMSKAGGSSLRLAAGDLMKGDMPDLGEGFFVGMKEGELGAEQRNLAQRLKVNGEWISLGRSAADIFFDPGDTGYKMMSGVIDGAVALGADPTNIALGGLSNVRRMNKLIAPPVRGAEAFAEGARKSGFLGKGVAAMMAPGIERNVAREMAELNAGMVAGRSQSLNVGRANAFLDDPNLSTLYEKWGDKNYGFQQIWEDSGRKLPVQLAAMLGDTKNADEARALIRRAVLNPNVEEGVALTKKAQLGEAGAINTGILGEFSDRLAKFDAAKRRRINTGAPRLFRQMPAGQIDIKDFDKHPWKMNAAVEKLDSFQRLMKFDPDQIAENNRLLATIKDPAEAYDLVVNKIMGDQSRGVLVRSGMSPKGAREATKMWSNYHRDIMRYGVDKLGENIPIPMTLNGEPVKTIAPGLLSEALEGMIPLPDTRRLRQLTAAPWVRAITEIPGYKGTVDALDFVMFQIWRPMTLLRGAWSTKILGEEQFRMEASGLDAPLFHPIHFIANVVRKRGDDVDFAGNPLEEMLEFQEAMNKTRNFLDDPTKLSTKGVVTYGREDPEFPRSIASELAYLNTDELSRLVAQKGKEWVKGWVRANPEGQALQARYRKSLNNEIFDTPEGVARYIDEYIFPRIQAKTGGNAELMDAIATGNFRGAKLLDYNNEGIWNGLNKEAIGHFTSIVDDALVNPSSPWASVLPERVRGSLTITDPKSSGLKDRWDRVTQFLFTNLMTRPTNYLSRSVAFRQYYWDSGASLIGRMTPDAQAQMLHNLDRAKAVPRELAERVRTAARRGSGDMEMKDAQMLAKAEALGQTRALLYDIQTKGNWADATRHIFPFAEAWKEVMTRWARIGFEHPEALRRGQQGISAARQSGFFQTDPETGEESFIYPGSNIAMQAFGIGNMPMTGAVSNLNIFTQSVLPGFGPVVQIAANKLLPHKPEWDEIKSIISPYGDPIEAEGWIVGLAPAWAKRLKHALADPENDRLLGNTVIDMQNYLYSTGEFDTSTPEGQMELQQEAIKRARLVFVARAAGPLLGTPANPSLKPMAYDKNGDLHVQRLMFDNLRALGENPGTVTTVGNEKVEGVGYDRAVQAFMEKYGDQALLFLQPKTYAVVPGAPTTDKGLDWIRENPEMAEKYPNVYGFFAPSEGEFDYAAYLRTLQTGERESLTPDEQLALAHDKYASMIYYNFKDKVGPSPSDQQRAALRLLKTTLEKKFPGFGTAKIGLPERATPEQQLAELQDAVENPQLRDTPAGRALAAYLEARQVANRTAQGLGLTGFARGKEARNIRTAMRQLGGVLSQKSPQFALMYDRVLEREMDLDEEADGGEGTEAAIEQLVQQRP